MPKSPEQFIKRAEDAPVKEAREKVKFEIYDNNKALVASMKRAVEYLDLPPAAIISLQYSKENQENEYLNGKNYAELQKLIQKKIEKENLPVVLWDIESLEYLTRNPEFYALFGYKKVGFIKEPIELAELPKLIAKLDKMPNIKDELAFKVARLKFKENMIGRFRHDLSPGHKRVFRQAIIDLNRIYNTNFDPEKDQAKAYKFISNYQLDFGKEFEGEKLKGVFCDAEGTLFDSKTGKMNLKILEKLDEYDKKEFVRIWTGGKIEETKKVLAKENRSWMVLSKYDFHGSEPEVVIDDLSEDEFKKQYGIKPQTFINTRKIDSKAVSEVEKN